MFCLICSCFWSQRTFVALVATVCNSWNKATQYDLLWKSLFEKDFGLVVPPKEHSWKQKYKKHWLSLASQSVGSRPAQNKTYGRKLKKVVAENILWTLEKQ